VSATSIRGPRCCFADNNSLVQGLSGLVGFPFTVGGLLRDVFADIVLDKFLGNIPIVGVYFNAICARVMTWRLGALFGFMSCGGNQVSGDTVGPAMQLIKKLFPQDQMFKFQTPDRDCFVRFVCAASVTDEADPLKRIRDALDSLDGKG
jgi:hypothetical protein